MAKQIVIPKPTKVPHNWCWIESVSYTHLDVYKRQALEHLINRFQKLGQTSSQIILSTPVDKRSHL